MLHDAESDLHQKLLIIDSIPERHLISNISEITNCTKQVKYFSDLIVLSNYLVYVVKANFEFEFLLFLILK